MSEIDPYVQPIPRAFLTDPEIRAWFEYDNLWKHSVFVATTNSTGTYIDPIAPHFDTKNQINRVFPIVQSLINEVALLKSQINTNTNHSHDDYKAVTVSGSHDATSKEFINAKNGARVTLPLYPSENDTIIFKGGDASGVELWGNGRTIDGEDYIRIRRKGTTRVVQYFIDTDEWLIR